MRSRWKSNNNDETATAVAVPPRQGISSPNNNFNFNSRMGEESGAKLSILEMEIAATTPSVKPRRRFTTSESDDNTAEMVDVENTSPIPNAIPLRNPNRQIGAVNYDYVAREHDELSIKRGSVVEVINTECDEDGWILAKDKNRKGMIPKNYVILVGSQPNRLNPSDIVKSEKLIGEGGFATVMEGTYRGKPVALKIPKRQYQPEKVSKIRAALEREALILSRLNHKNIVGFVGLSVEPMYLVLKLCQGGTLFNLCRKMSCSDVLTVIYWAKQITSAMEHLHTRDDPLVHADLKADNVLIRERPCNCGLNDEKWKIVTNYHRDTGLCRQCGGTRIDLLTLKLTDFGLSRSLLDKKPDILTGSIPWMPPETLKSYEYSKKSDVWSFGVFLWETLSCRIPFENYQFQVVMFAIVNHHKTLPVPENCPEELKVVFDGCWKREANERINFSTILELLEVAEGKIDSTYRWVVKKDQEREKRCEGEEEITLDEIEQQIKAGKIKLNVQTIAQRILKGPVPAERSKKRDKRARMSKENIGAPSDFRHNVSVRPSSRSPPPSSDSGRSSSQGRLFVVKYGNFGVYQQQNPVVNGGGDEEEPMNVVVPLRPPKPATLFARRNNGGHHQQEDGGSGGYETLPRRRGGGEGHRYEVGEKGEIQQRKQRFNNNAVAATATPCQHVQPCFLHKCLAKKEAFLRELLANRRFGPCPKPSKSNPELAFDGFATTPRIQLKAPELPPRRCSPTTKEKLPRKIHDYIPLGPSYCGPGPCTHIIHGYEQPSAAAEEEDADCYYEDEGGGGEDSEYAVLTGDSSMMMGDVEKSQQPRLRSSFRAKSAVNAWGGGRQQQQNFSRSFDSSSTFRDGGDGGASKGGGVVERCDYAEIGGDDDDDNDIRSEEDDESTFSSSSAVVTKPLGRTNAFRKRILSPRGNQDSSLDFLLLDDDGQRCYSDAATLKAESSGGGNGGGDASTNGGVEERMRKKKTSSSSSSNNAGGSTETGTPTSSSSSKTTTIVTINDGTEGGEEGTTPTPNMNGDDFVVVVGGGVLPMPDDPRGGGEMVAEAAAADKNRERLVTFPNSMLGSLSPTSRKCSPTTPMTTVTAASGSFLSLLQQAQQESSSCAAATGDASSSAIKSSDNNIKSSTNSPNNTATAKNRKCSTPGSVSSNSIWYVHDLESCVGGECSSPSEFESETPRKRSSSNRKLNVGQLISKVTNMLGVRNSSSISAIGGGGHCEQCSTEIILPLPSSSPGEVTTHCCSSTECGGGQAAATKGGGGGGLSVVQEARCFHPHHIGGGDPTRSKVHVCLQRCNTFASSPHFPPILLSPVVELEDYCGGGGSQYKNGVLTHHHHPKEQQQQQQQQTPRNFVKLADYPGNTSNNSNNVNCKRQPRNLGSAPKHHSERPLSINTVIQMQQTPANRTSHVPSICLNTPTASSSSTTSLHQIPACRAVSSLNSRNLSSNLPPHGGAFLSPNDLPSSPAASTQQWGILHQRSQSSDANPQQQQQQQQRVFVSAEEIIADLLAKPLSLDGPIFNLAYISMGSSAGPGEAPPLPESADQQQQKVRRQSSGASFTLVKNTAADSDDAKCGDPPLPKRPPKAGIAGGNIDAFEPQQQQRPIPVPRSIKPFPLPPAPLKSQQTPRNNTVEAPTSKAPVLIRRSNLFGEAIDGGEAASPSFQTEPSVASSQKQKSPPQQSQQQQRRPNTLNLHGDGATGGPGNGSDKYQPAFSRSPPPQTLDSTASSGGGTSGGPPLMKRCREGKTPIVSPPPPLTATDRESEQPPSSPQMEECAITVFGVSPVSAPTSFTILTTRPASAAEERQDFHQQQQHHRQCSPMAFMRHNHPPGTAAPHYDFLVPSEQPPPPPPPSIPPPLPPKAKKETKTASRLSSNNNISSHKVPLIPRNVLPPPPSSRRNTNTVKNEMTTATKPQQQQQQRGKR